MSIEQTERPFPFTPQTPWGPPPEFTELCVNEPIIRVTLPSGDQAWLVSRYDDVRQVFADPRFSRAAATAPGAPTLISRPTRARGVLSHDSLLGKDAPDHARLRRLVAKTFTMRHIDRLRPRLQRITDALLDAVIATGPPGELVTHFAVPLSSTALYELLGLPDVDRDRLRLWLDAQRDSDAPNEEAAEAARATMDAYVARLIADKRAAPTEDLLSDLIAARDEQGRLSENELTTMLTFLLFAGQAGTAVQIPRFVLVLLRHPEQLRLLREHPEHISTAVEELLRYTPFAIGSGFPRVATQDVELAGVLIRAGEAVIPHSMSANRDPSVFDEPDRLDLARTDNPHVSFGHGIHHCLGAPLARAEMQIALNTLVRRLPGLRLAIDEQELDWQFANRANRAFPRLRALPVTW